MEFAVSSDPKQYIFGEHKMKLHLTQAPTIIYLAFAIIHPRLDSLPAVFLR